MGQFLRYFVLALCAASLVILVGCDAPKVDISKSKIPGGGLSSSRPTKVPTAPPTGKPEGKEPDTKKESAPAGG